jgi:hypothetical protein
MKFDISVFFVNLSRKFKLRYNPARMTRTLRECMIISRSFLLRMRNISDKICGETQTTHFMFSAVVSENLAVYEMRQNMVQHDRPQMTI